MSLNFQKLNYTNCVREADISMAKLSATELLQIANQVYRAIDSVDYQGIVRHDKVAVEKQRRV